MSDLERLELLRKKKRLAELRKAKEAALSQQPVVDATTPTKVTQSVSAGDLIAGGAKNYAGGAENILSLASSAALEPIAGIAGLASEGLQGLGFDVPDGADVVRKVQGFAYQPKTEAGQRMQQGVAQALGQAGEFITENIAKPLGIDDLGGKTLEKTRSPVLATIVDIMPELAVEVLPATAIGGKVIKNSRNARKLLADRIKKGDIDTGTIAKTLDANGELIKNPNLKKAIKLMGDDEAAYNTAINFERMNDATKKQVNKMLDVIEANKKSGDPKAIMNNRPAAVVGESLARRVNSLDQIKREASSNINKLINGELGSKPVNVNKARDSFISSLGNSDIKFDFDDAGNLIADTSNTLTNINEVISTEKLNNILKRIQTGNITAKEAHKLKRNLSEMVSYDPSSPGSVKVSVEIENAIKDLSRGLGDSIKKESKAYSVANKKFSDSIDALKEADRLLGKRLMIGDKLADSKFGALSKRIGTNLASREDVKAFISTVDDALAKNNIKFKDDIERQVAALADMEKIFKVESSQAPFGFQSRVAQGTAEGIVTGGSNLVKEGVDIALDKFRSMTQMEFEDKMKALRAISKSKKQ